MGNTSVTSRNNEIRFCSIPECIAGVQMYRQSGPTVHDCDIQPGYTALSTTGCRGVSIYSLAAGDTCLIYNTGSTISARAIRPDQALLASTSSSMRVCAGCTTTSSTIGILLVPPLVSLPPTTRRLNSVATAFVSTTSPFQLTESICRWVRAWLPSATTSSKLTAQTASAIPLQLRYPPQQLRLQLASTRRRRRTESD